MVLGAMLVVWEVAVRVLEARPFILPAPTVILKELAQYPGFYAKHSLYTLGITGLGFLIAAAGGVLIAVGIVYSRFLDRTLSAFLVSFNAVPRWRSRLCS
jgi:NitT/TauT family transport system permease protein